MDRKRDEVENGITGHPSGNALLIKNLARLCRCAFTTQALLAYLDQATQNLVHFRLLHIGFGDGEILRRVACWARKREIAVALAGVDIDPLTAEIARKATPGDLSIEYLTGDWFDLPGTFDLIILSNGARCVPDRPPSELLRFLEDRTKRGWLIWGLRQGSIVARVSGLLADLIGLRRTKEQELTSSAKHDLSKSEWQDVARAVDIPRHGFRIRSRFPFGLSIERIRVWRAGWERGLPPF